VVNYKELEVMTRDWLLDDSPTEKRVNVKDYALLTDYWLDEYVFP